MAASSHIMQGYIELMGTLEPNILHLTKCEIFFSQYLKQTNDTLYMYQLLNQMCTQLQCYANIQTT